MAFAKLEKTNENTTKRYPFPFVCRFFVRTAFLWLETAEMESIMNNKKTTIAMICVAWVAALPLMAFAASGVIELEIPGMNPVTAA